MNLKIKSKLKHSQLLIIMSKTKVSIGFTIKYIFFLQQFFYTLLAPLLNINKYKDCQIFMFFTLMCSFHIKSKNQLVF